ncbi:MAG: gamma-glutamylcyclotransferase family protein [Myxococcota bacterium]
MQVAYFAYGSNLDTSRLRMRLDHIEVVGPAVLHGWRFAVDKRGSDGSAKANIHPAGSRSVYGVVYRFDGALLPRLDAIEGGYERVLVELDLYPRPSRLSCHTYCSDRVADDLPFDWYVAHMVRGAVEHGLPPDWIRQLSDLPSKLGPP